MALVSPLSLSLWLFRVSWVSWVWLVCPVLAGLSSETILPSSIVITLSA